MVRLHCLHRPLTIGASCRELICQCAGQSWAFVGKKSDPGPLDIDAIVGRAAFVLLSQVCFLMLFLLCFESSIPADRSSCTIISATGWYDFERAAESCTVLMLSCFLWRQAHNQVAGDVSSYHRRMDKLRIRIREFEN